MTDNLLDNIDEALNATETPEAEADAEDVVEETPTEEPAVEEGETTESEEEASEEEGEPEKTNADYVKERKENQKLSELESRIAYLQGQLDQQKQPVKEEEPKAETNPHDKDIYPEEYYAWENEKTQKATQKALQEMNALKQEQQVQAIQLKAQKADMMAMQRNPEYSNAKAAMENSLLALKKMDLQSQYPMATESQIDAEAKKQASELLEQEILKTVARGGNLEDTFVNLATNVFGFQAGTQQAKPGKPQVNLKNINASKKKSTSLNGGAAAGKRTSKEIADLSFEKLMTMSDLELSELEA